jgi:hypothetical protein
MKKYFYWVTYKSPTAIGTVAVDTLKPIDSEEKILVVRNGIVKKHFGQFMRNEDLLILNWKLLRHAHK